MPKPTDVSGRHRPTPMGVFGKGGDIDLPAPVGVAPPADLDLPAPRGAIPKPSAPRSPVPISIPAPHAGESDLPAPRRRPAPPDEVNLPAPRKPRVAPPIGDLDLPVRAKPPTPPDEVDLPAPRRPRVAPPIGDLDLPPARRKIAPPLNLGPESDLPAPRAPAPKPAEFGDLDLPVRAKPPAPPAIDDLDLPAPRFSSRGSEIDALDEVDLPARAVKKPIAPPLDELDLPAAKSPATVPRSLDLDLPAPRSGTPRPGMIDVDLPAPTSALANEAGTPFDDLELPSARSAADLPSLKGFGDLDLPQPRRSVTDEADEAFSDLDLPMPRSAAADPFGGLDLPVPQSAADLPIPKSDSFGDLELPEPRSDAPGFGELDLPTPRDVADLPAPAEYGDLPTVSGGMDLPAPKGELDDDLSLPEPRAHAGAPGSSTDAAAGGTAFGELDLGGSADTDDMEFADIPQAEGDRDSLPPPRVAVPATKVAPSRAAPRKSKAALVAGAILALLLAAGGALGFTSFGVFGINLLEPFMPGAGDPAQVQSVIRAAEDQSRTDRYVDIRASLIALGNARRTAGLNQRLLSRSLLHLGLYRARFSGSSATLRASAIRSRMTERGMTGPDVALAYAADALGDGNEGSARNSLGPALGTAASDPYVNLVLGEIELIEGNLDAAIAAFEASAEGGAGARGLWGIARARLAGEDDAATRAAVEAVLAESPQHGEALVALARLRLAAGDVDGATEVAERAAGQTPEHLRVAPRTRAYAWSLLGQVREGRGRQTQALAAYEAALGAVDAHIPALLGAGRVLLADRPADALPRFDAVLNADDATSLVLDNGRTAQQEAQLGAARAMLALDRAQEAKASLDALVEALEDDAEVLLWLGRAESSLDPPNYAAAEQQFRAAIHAQPEMFAAYLALAELFLATERGSDAGAVLQQATSRVPETAEMRLQLGQFELRRNRHADAIRELRRALAMDAELPAALFSLGVAQRRSGQLAAADTTFTRLAEIDARYPGLSLERGLLYEARGESERAVVSYERALESNPDDMDLLLRLGAAQVSADRIDAAEETLERVRESRPNSAEANHFVGRVAFARGQFTEALAHFRRAIQIDPSRGEFHLYVGWAALESGQLGEALRAVDDAIERDPSLGDAFWIRGAIKLRSGRPADALEDLQRAIQLRPSRYEIYAAMGDAFDQLRRVREAVEAYRTATSHIDDNGQWFYRLGRLLMDQGQTRDAGAALQRATLLGDAAPTTPGWLADAHRVRGDVLRLLGSGREAVPHYRRYLHLAPASAIDRREVRQRLLDLGEVPND